MAIIENLNNGIKYKLKTMHNIGSPTTETIDIPVLCVFLSQN